MEVEHTCLHGTTVYLQTTQTGSPGSPRSALKRRLEQLGARVTSRLSKSTTHVVYHRGHEADEAEDATRLNETLSRVSQVQHSLLWLCTSCADPGLSLSGVQIAGDVPVVSPLWVEHCAEHGEKVPVRACTVAVPLLEGRTCMTPC